MISTRKHFFPALLILVLATAGFGVRARPPAQAASDLTCRFGITVPNGLTDGEGNDYRPKFPELRVGSYLDWGAHAAPEHPNNADHIQVLRVRDDLYTDVLASLATLVSADPGAYWQVGNEPDTCYENQDCILPETYANRYYAIATQIRALDPEARVGFGSVVQPTSIRKRYLDRAWAQLVSLAGDKGAASDLIDFWSIHSFILNEQPGEWGTGVPPGFESDYGDAVDYEIVFVDGQWDVPETHDNSIFNDRLIDFRAWMHAKGQEDKPLWITEYGSLFPPIDPPGGPNYLNVSDTETARFMTESFDFLRSAADSTTGHLYDGGRLVQRWYWYSMNEYRYTFGGSLYDPDSSAAITEVGTQWVSYPYLLAGGFQADPYVADLTLESLGSGQYRFNVVVPNKGDTLLEGGFDVQVFLGNPDSGGTQVGSTVHVDDSLNGCGEFVVVELTGELVEPIPWDLYVRLIPGVPTEDADLGNNQQSFMLPDSFADVGTGHLFYAWIEVIYADGITGGCALDPLRYCPDLQVSRAQMAKFLLLAEHGSGYTPPEGSGAMYDDVPEDHLFVDWIEQLTAEGITSGCSASPPFFCPEEAVSRAQMAKFLLLAEHGSSYTPPPGSGTVYDDVPAAHPFVDWIEQLSAEGVTSGCGGGNYCPDLPVSRGQMAAFLVRTFDLSMP